MDAFGRMMAGAFLVQKMLVLQLCASKWIRSYIYNLKKTKSLCRFSALCVGQQNLEGGNSRLILLSVSRALAALTPSSSAKKDGGIISASWRHK